MTATMTELPPGVVYKPGTLGCRREWRTGHIVSDAVMNPTWSITGEDGTTMTVFREVGDFNGRVTDPDGTRRSGWDMGRPGCHTPLGRADWQKPQEQATDTELAVMNNLLRPLALAEPWEVELARMAPCRHEDSGCTLWRGAGQ